jgi:hypothetical protein
MVKFLSGYRLCNIPYFELVIILLIISHLLFFISHELTSLQTRIVNPHRMVNLVFYELLL